MKRQLIAVLSATLVGGCVGPFSEMIQREYANADAAKAADAVGQHRWIPAILPEDAGNIREVHNIDTNQTWGCFQTKRADMTRALLRQAEAREAPGPIANGPSEVFRDFSWWPKTMRTGALEAWQFREAPACPACGATVVRVGIDAAGGLVCFYRRR